MDTPLALDKASEMDLEARREAERRGVPVLLTTDHGSIHCHTPATVYAKRDTTSNLRYKFGDDLRAQEPDAALVVDDLPASGLPARSPGTRLLLATGDRCGASGRPAR